MALKKLDSTLIETVGVMVGMYVCSDTIPHDKTAMRSIAMDICNESGYKWTKDGLTAIIAQAEQYISENDF